MAGTPAVLAYEAKRRWRRSWRLYVVIASAILLGVAGKLCWSKFAPPVRRHFDALAAQRAIERRSDWFGAASEQDDSGARRVGHRDASTFLARAGADTSTSRYCDVVWAGRLQAKPDEPRLVVVFDYSDQEGRGFNSPAEEHVSLLTFVFSPGTLLSAARLARMSELSVPLQEFRLVGSRRSDDLPSQVFVDVASRAGGSSLTLTLQPDDSVTLEKSR